ncbi:MAG: hypothetical protein JNM94_17945 [Phycisphaerae bacterium]|nr:hypothetical protein [Phycisphaerae bacterium]
MSQSVQADFQYFVNNFDGWSSSSGDFATCSFAEFPQNTFITDQYADLGVNFTGIFGNVVNVGLSGFPLDGHGIDGNCGIELTFSNLTYAVAAHGPDSWRFDAYLGDQLIYSSPSHGSSIGGFSGFVSSVPFDRVRLLGATLFPPDCDDVYVDNIYFASVPGPAGFAVFAIRALGMGRRRR